jgi:hypothetical protein
MWKGVKMYSNFIADKQSSESYGVICVRFGTVSGEEIISGGSETELKVEKTPRSSDFHIVSQEYTNPISFKFQIINEDGSNIDEVKERVLVKWLCKRNIYYNFQILDERFFNLIYKVNISNHQLIKVGNVVGMEFNVNCKSPFAYTNPIVKTFNITSINQHIKLLINNDNDDYIYPNIVITSNTSGDLTITNSTEIEYHEFTIKNLSNGEIIKINGSIPDIETNLTGHSIWSDFNKHWIRFTDGLNELSFNNLCTINITYSEPRKVGVV